MVKLKNIIYLSLCFIHYVLMQTPMQYDMNPKYYKIYDNDVLDPFANYSIDDNTFLDNAEERTLCGKCCRSRKYFCYTCNLALPQFKNRTPKVKLPFKIDIIKHEKETEGKSTSTHAAIICPDDVTIYLYPKNVPDYTKYKNTILIYPGKSSVELDEYIAQFSQNQNENQELSTTLDNLNLVQDENSNNSNSCIVPFERAVFIDATWPQSRGIMAHSTVHTLPCVTLKKRISYFWRHQKNSPRWYLATIEAIHQLLYESHPKHNGQYDNILFFFEFMYRKIHSIYSYESLLAYQRKMTERQQQQTQNSNEQ